MPSTDANNRQQQPALQPAEGNTHIRDPNRSVKNKNNSSVMLYIAAQS
ncbi:hypothetical protein Tco_1012135, partial [Tanacetum coccineum]